MGIFKKLCVLAMGLTLSAGSYAQSPADLSTISISDSLTRVERNVRGAAVRVTDGEGHGSGSIVRYHDMQLVLTAQHVADGMPGHPYIVVNGNTQAVAILIYSDPSHDIAVLYLAPDNPLSDKGLRYRPRTEILDVGGSITYSGHPSYHSLMTYRGYVAGRESIPGSGVQLLLNTYGWFGCSGSVVYDTSGRIVGILWGVDIERHPTLQVQENMVWVSPIQNLDLATAIVPLCEALENEPRACRR